MSAMIKEHMLDRVGIYQEQNVSNNGQLVYTQCQQSKAVSPGDVYIGNMDIMLHAGEHLKPKDQLDQDSKHAFKAEYEITRNSGKIDDHDMDSVDDIEIVLYQDRITGELIIETVDKKYFCLESNTEDKFFLAASFDVRVPQETRISTFPSVDELVAASDMLVKETKCLKETPDKYPTTKNNKNVHFGQLSESPQKLISLKSHKMVKDKMLHGKQEETHKDSESERRKTNTSNHPKPTARSAHASSSDSNVNKSPTRKSLKSNSCPGKNANYGTIKILRRGCENVSSMEQTKGDVEDYDKVKDIDYGPEHMHENLSNKRHDMYNDENKLSKQTMRVRGTGMCSEYTKTSMDNFQRNTLNDAYHDPTRKFEINKEMERQKKQIRKKKRQNKIKGKPQKSSMEIYQRQLETGQLKSMISRYKTEGLRNIKLLEQIHKGIYRTIYKASYQNKRVVLTVYDAEYTDEIKLLDMALMPNSYFVQGFNDYMVGPSRRQWSMSMHHPLGDLQILMSRDLNRRVIGEVHTQFIVAGVLLGVDFLHHNDIVHGNLKPSKILINSLGYPVVTGFVKSQAETDREDMNPFTPAYAAQERRDSRDPAIDIFSVGVVAYEMITARIPRVGYKSDRKDLDQLVYNPELFSYAGEIFIHHCLQYDPNERFTIGEDRKHLLSEEWFSTLDWRNIRRQTIKSPILNAMQLIDNKATLSWEEKCVEYGWGRVMDALCPNTPTLQHEECHLE